MKQQQRKGTLILTCSDDANPHGFFSTDIALTFEPELDPDQVSNLRVMVAVMLAKLEVPIPECLHMSPNGKAAMKDVITTGRKELKGIN